MDREGESENEHGDSPGRPRRKRKQAEYVGMVGAEPTTTRAARRRGHMDRAGTPSGELKYMIQTGYHMMQRIEEHGDNETRPWE